MRNMNEFLNDLYIQITEKPANVETNLVEDIFPGIEFMSLCRDMRVMYRIGRDMGIESEDVEVMLRERIAEPDEQQTEQDPKNVNMAVNRAFECIDAFREYLNSMVVLRRIEFS